MRNTRGCRTRREGPARCPREVPPAPRHGDLLAPVTLDRGRPGKPSAVAHAASGSRSARFLLPEAPPPSAATAGASGGYFRPAAHSSATYARLWRGWRLPAPMELPRGRMTVSCRPVTMAGPKACRRRGSSARSPAQSTTRRQLERHRHSAAPRSRELLGSRALQPCRSATFAPQSAGHRFAPSTACGFSPSDAPAQTCRQQRARLLACDLGAFWA